MVIDANDTLRFLTAYFLNQTKLLSASYFITSETWRRGGPVVERRTPEREVGGSILTRIAMLYP